MSSRRTLGSLVALLALLPGSAAAQTGTEADGGSATASPTDGSRS